jgi:hypothetical protein
MAVFLYEFDWDPAKAPANFGKHGSDFEWAATVFLDPFAAAISDEEHSAIEVHGGKSALTLLRSIIPIFRRLPKSSSPSSAVPRRNWWPCVWMPTYWNGFSSTAPVIQRASITFFGW